jgi:hypothetical protein
MSEVNTKAPLIPLDPTRWAEPKQKFIGRLTRCEYSDTDHAKSREGETFTEMRGWPRAGQTWEVAVERIDAQFVDKNTNEVMKNDDGSIARPHRYQTIDLERYDERTRAMKPITSGNNKANFVIGEWVKAKVRLNPNPAANVGMIAEFEVMFSKSFGGGQPAKNLLYPVKVLAMPGTPYEYRGDVENVQIDPESRGGGSGGGAGISLDNAAEGIEAGSNGASAPKAAAKTIGEAAVLELLVGLAPDADFSDFLAEHKGELDGPVRVGLVGGTYVPAMMEAGKLVIVDDVLALPM